MVRGSWFVIGESEIVDRSCPVEEASTGLDPVEEASTGRALFVICCSWLGLTWLSSLASFGWESKNLGSYRFRFRFFVALWLCVSQSSAFLDAEHQTLDPENAAKVLKYPSGLPIGK